VSDSRLRPHVVERNLKKVCSECRQELPPDVQPSLSKAFRAHVEEKHRSEREEYIAKKK
jgi:hypothetical protein